MNIFYKQRNKAETRAKGHARNEKPYKCHFIEIDPKPDLPLDSVIWGSPANLQAPMTSYSYAFQDPKKLLE
jgi:hypothetical protein